MISVPPFPKTVDVSLRQAWRPTPEEGFRPATVRLSYKPGHLLIVAQLTDDAIFTRAKGFNEHLWELGDAFEMFLRPLPGEMYMEYHVAPGNKTMQLQFPSAKVFQALRNGTSNRTSDSFFVAPKRFESTTKEEKGQWEARIDLPDPNVQVGRQWRFSFSRYDATPNSDKLILSSTSAHTVLDFHDQSAWQTMEFVR